MPEILALMGSPRKKGNTSIVLEAVLEPIRAAKVPVTRLDVAHLRVKGCAECLACQQVLDKPGCAVEDDMQGIYERLLAAHLVLFATPVFCWGATAQLKAVMDRCYALFKFNTGKFMLEGKRVAVVVTSGGDVFDGADLVIEQVRRFAEFARVSLVGRHWADRLTTPERTGANVKVLEAAREFGGKLLTAVVP